MLSRKQSIDDNKKSIKDIIEVNLSKFFINNSIYSKEEKKFLMKYQTLHKLLKQADIINSNFTSTEFEITVREATKSKFIFKYEDFQNIVLYTAKKVFHEDFIRSKQIAVLNLSKQIDSISSLNTNNDQSMINTKNIARMSNIGGALTHNNLNTQTNQNQSFFKKFDKNDVNTYGVEDFDIFLDEFVIELEQKKVVNVLENTLMEIYSYFFHFELSNHNDVEKIKNESLSALIKFLKYIEVTPYLLSINSLNKYWVAFLNYDHEKLIPEEKIIGSLYTLNSFMVTLIHLSYFFSCKRLTFSKQNKLSDTDKLLVFFKFVCSTKGFAKIRSIRGNNKGFTLIPSIDFLNSIGCSTELFPKFYLIQSLKSLNFNSGRFINLINEAENKEMFNRSNRSFSLLKHNQSFDSSSSLPSVNGNNENALIKRSNKIDFNSSITKNNILEKLFDEPNILDTNYLFGNEKIQIKETGEYIIKLKQILDLDSETLSALENFYIEGIKSVYLYYVRLGEKADLNEVLSFSKYLQMFEDMNIVNKRKKCGLYVNKQLIYKKGLVEYHKNLLDDSKNDKEIALLTNNDLLLIFTDLTCKKTISKQSDSTGKKDLGKIRKDIMMGNKSLNVKNNNIIGKIGFKVFIKSLEIISSKIYSNMSKSAAFVKFLNEVSLIYN